MIHTIDQSSEAEGAMLRAMFEARKSVFVDLLKWDVPVLGGTWEIDQFDDEHASYIILADPSGRHLGSARLLKTDRPHILSSLFAELCEGPVPAGGDIREITRFCLDRHLSARERRQVRNQLVTALAEFGLANGVSRYTGVAEVGWFQQILAFGWRCMPLGLPKIIGNRMLAALTIHIDPETRGLLMEAGTYAGFHPEMNAAAHAA